MIDLTCHNCRFVGAVPDTLAGKKVRCKHCGQLIAVPEQNDFQEYVSGKDIEADLGLADKTMYITFWVLVALGLFSCCGLLPLIVLVKL